MATRTANYIVGDPAFAVDKTGVIVLWNKAAEGAFGMRAVDVLGKRCWKLLEGKDVFGNRYCGEHCPLRDMAARNEVAHGFPINFKTAEEGRREFSLNSLLVFDDSGNMQLLHICQSSQEKRELPAHQQSLDDQSGPAVRSVLTNREVEVLQHLADSRATREIARLMFISHATVRNHVQHILNKLQVHNRLEAVLIAQRIDLI